MRLRRARERDDGPCRLTRRRVLAAAAIASGLIAALPGCAGGSPPPAPGSTRPGGGPGRIVVASVPYWNMARGTATVLAHRQDFSEVSPWFYRLDSRGRIEADDAAAVAAQISRLRSAGVAIVPTLANFTAGKWAYQPLAGILHDPARMRRHVSAIVALVRQHGYAGIDIDYEDLRASDRQGFTAFIAALAAALHAHGKLLSVDVYAKTSQAAQGGFAAAQDYRALGRAADQMRVMAYDYHWPESAAGPLAPIGWVREVLRYARTQIPARKIIAGVPLYGYDWAGRKGTAVGWQDVRGLLARHHVAVRYDRASQAPWFSYTDGSGRRHAVWFENAASSRAKLGAARRSGAGGVFLWMPDGADPATWPALTAGFVAGERAGAGTRG